MRWLCLDPGLKRTGVAISSPAGGFAVPLLVLEHDADGPSLDDIASLMREHNAQGLVIGFPLSMDGTASAQTRDVFKFALRTAQHLRALLQVPPDVVLPEMEGEDAALGPTDNRSGVTVTLWDERLTSWEAQRVAGGGDGSRRKKARALDAHAAAVILQSFLDARSEMARSERTSADGTGASDETD